MSAHLLLSLDFTDPGMWVSLVTLCFLEIVLGVDNIIFISLVTGKLPKKEQARTRNIGMLLAMAFRVCLLLGINLLIALKEPVVTIPAIFSKVKGTAIGLSYKDLILIAGGMFLLVKSSMEIRHKMNEVAGNPKDVKTVKQQGFAGILLQIVLVDAVFSFDSILTAVGLVDNVMIMIVAVIISMGIMMLFAGAVSAIINKYPTLQMLALSFLVVIGVVLIAGGFHEEINKSIIYSCLGFSLIVELLNIRFRKKNKIAEKRPGGD